MAEAVELQGRITQVTKKQDGFKIDGYQDWFNIGRYYSGPALPPAGSQVSFEYDPWTGDDGKTRFQVRSLTVANGAGQPAPVASPPAPDPAPAPAPTPTGPATTPQPQSYDEYRAANGSPQPETASPEPGTFAYRDTVIEPRTRHSIERQVALKAAVETIVGAGGLNRETELPEALKVAVLHMADEFIDWLEDIPPPEVESESVEPSP